MALRGGQANSPSRSGARRGTTGGSANRGTQASLQPGGGHTRQDSVRRDSGRNNMQEMSESQIVGFLGRKIWQAMNDEDGDLSDVRKENFNYYTGMEYGTERDGYSKFVTREALETVEWVLPSVLRVFLSGDNVVAFEPVGPDDEDAADQETDMTNYFLMKANKNGEGGFVALHHWFKDALMYPNGYIKAYMEERYYTDVGTVTGLTEMGVKSLMDDPDVEILEQRVRTVEVEISPDAMQQAPTPPPQQQPPQQQPGATNNMMGNPAPMSPGGQPNPNDTVEGTQEPPPNVVPFPPPEETLEVYDLKIRTSKMVMELRVDPVPPEEALIDNDCVSQNCDDADFVCHRVRKPYTRLVDEGYDPDELDQVGLGEDYQWNDERVNRLFYEDEDPDAEDEDDPSMRTFWVHECYAWFDYEGTGTAQHRRVVLIGDRVFENEETNYQPLIAMSSILMAHKHNGMSYVDIMKDLQILQSTLTRQLLDNIYKINVRRKVFSEDALTEDGSTMEAILNTQAEFIPVRGPAQAAFVPEPTQSIVGELLPVIQHFAERNAVRTGVTPESGVAANDLQEVRQEVFSNALDRASQRIEMLVRIFAETGVRQLMLKIHQLLRSHWDVSRAVKLRGEWIDVDPQGWRDRTDMTVNVGLGYSTKQQQLGMLVQLLSMQKEAAPEGMANGAKIYNTLEKLVNASGIGDPRQFFIDPDSPEFKPPPPPEPDAQTILAQAQAKALEQEQNRKDQEAQAEIQLKQQEAQQKAAIAQEELIGKRQDRQLKARELALKQVDMENKGFISGTELEAKVRNIDMDTQLKAAQADKAIADAASSAIETTETFRNAQKIVSQGGEMAEGGSDELTAEYDDDEDDDDAET